MYIITSVFVGMTWATYIIYSSNRTHTDSKRREVKIIGGIIDVITKEVHIRKKNTSAGVTSDVLRGHAVVSIFSLGTSDQVSNCKRQIFIDKCIKVRTLCNATVAREHFQRYELLSKKFSGLQFLM